MCNHMKYKLAIVFLHIALVCFTQDADSIKVTHEIDSLVQTTKIHLGKSEFDEAIQTILIAEKKILEKFGKENANYGNCCNIHGVALLNKHNFAESEKYLLEAKEIRAKVLGKEDTKYTDVLDNLGVLYMNTGLFDKAEKQYLEAKAIREKTVGKEHIAYSKTLTNLGLLYDYLGKKQEAIAFLMESKSIQEKNGQTDNPTYAGCLINLGTMYYKASEYEKAEKLLLDAKNLFEVKINITTHPFYFNCLLNLANLYKILGEFEKAEPIYLKMLPLVEKTRGKEHPDYIKLLNSLATLYGNYGQFQKAEKLFSEALSIAEQVLGVEHPQYLSILNNVATFLSVTKPEKSLAMFNKLKSIYEKSTSMDTLEYCGMLVNMANFYSGMNQESKAEKLYLDVKDIFENKLNDREQPYYWNCLNGLEKIYMGRQEYAIAEQLLMTVKEGREKNLGKSHPDYLNSITNLCYLYAQMGETAKAETYFTEDAAINRKNIEGSLHFMSEKEISNYLSTFTLNQNLLFSFTQKSLSQQLIPVCYDNCLFYKGLLLNSINQIKRLASSSPGTAEEYNLFKSYKRQLAEQYSMPLAEQNALHIEELEEKANTIEKKLANSVNGFANLLSQVDWTQVQSNLKLSEAAIEFVNYNYVDEESTDSIRYAALVLKPGMKSPLFIPLFDEKEFRAILSKKREDKSGELLTQIYSRGATPIVPINSQKGLYNLCWKPLDSVLQGVKTVYYSPSGLLHQINFDAIPLENNIMLMDRFNLVRLGSTRSLVVPDLTKVNATNHVVLFGGIQYDLDTTQAKVDSSFDIPYGTSPEISFAYTNRSVSQKGDNWNYLPGTEKEVKEVANIIYRSKNPMQVYMGNLASEESFKMIGKDKESPKVLHLATHGFFFPDPKDKSRKPSVYSEEQSVFKISDHPMIRSGILLSGANYAWKNGKPFHERMEDGILTAYEISQMNLSNTELVVLSACETGLGDIQGNEGVYGLQRAFKIAGAKYLIMSLWQVPDKQTSMLMTTFYRKWLEAEGPDKGRKKMSIPDAFHAAQKDLRDMGLDPYQWAGFVLVE